MKLAFGRVPAGYFFLMYLLIDILVNLMRISVAIFGAVVRCMLFLVFMEHKKLFSLGDERVTF